MVYKTNHLVIGAKSKLMQLMKNFEQLQFILII